MSRIHLVGLLSLLVPFTLVPAQGQQGTATSQSVMGAGIFPVPHPTMDQYLKLDPANKTVWAGEGPARWPARPTVAAITANDLRTRVYTLADDSMRGRKVGTQDHFKATSYIAAEFKKMGLEPGGDNGSFFQVLPYGPTAMDSTRITLSVDGTPLVWKQDWNPQVPGATTFGPSFQGTNVATVFGGIWGDSSTPLDSAMISGKVVVFLAPVPSTNPGGAGRGGAGGGRGGAAGGRGGAGGGRGGAAAMPQELRPRDWRAALVLTANFDPSVVNMAPFRPGGNVLRSALPGGGAQITPAVVERIFGKPVSELKPGDTGKPVSGSFDYAPQPLPYPARNVIAIKRGSDPVLRNEYVVVGGHSDHEGYTGPGVDHDSLRAYNRVLKPQGANDRVAAGSETPEQWKEINEIIRLARTIRPARLDTVMNGADDDASGTAVMMEIAEAFARGPAPKRSVIFIAHAGEEAGMLGSKTFTDWPPVPRENIIAAINMDMLGKGRAIDVNLGGPNSMQLLGSRRLSTDFGNVFDSLNAVRSEPMAIDYTWEMFNRLRRFCRSDQVSYFRYNIPVAYVSLGYAVDYHMLTDEPQYVDYDHGARLGRFIHDVLETMANRKGRFVQDGPIQNQYQSCTG